ncbi:hypothetical protein TIIST44_07680 [Cutibacterium acnes subsp. defendens ATCC 11828]|nr:hypothetical protein TIIST44_07680 [Cutibacterium acnes subsp. defendens ATCC 11828]
MTGGHIVDDDEASDRDRLKNLVNIARSRYSDRYREQAEGAVIEQVIPGALDDLASSSMTSRARAQTVGSGS